ncbi:MAG: acyl-CoA dehydrogenase family protein [Halieaceae bacterium]|uniref:acyl-CoA dehydrogenase family protein n=1 Tax=Haliea alexandrii TaxID=2448162 RepID=UPI000F0BAE46|nr:acyl-CoA dehydrogenase family protein [Haliea alexandrii]MCR9183762.1 acyl-CoA dehydrogenase family protein [Halieaceae bacterium]
MHIDYTAEQRALRSELREYFQSLMTPELIEATRGNEGGEAYKSVIRQIGQDGWLALGWPKEYGGQGRGPMDQMIFFEEAQLARAPLPFVTISTVAPAIMAHGSEAHKAFFLPKIAAGELHFAIGYTEPDAGSDLAALKTTAVLEGDEWVINGTKVYTSSAEAADYIWLAARSDLEAPRPHAGISIFMVDAHQPGFSFAPIHTVGGVRTNMSYYNDVRCPNDMICGQVNGGWKLITSQLNHERVGLAAIGIYAYGLYQDVLAWSREPDAEGVRPIDDATVQRLLAECYARLEAMRLMTWRMAWSMEHGEPEVAYASAMKAFSTEGLIEVYRLLMDAMGPASMLHRGSTGAALAGDLEEEYRKCQINTFGGGVVELMRDLVAAFGLNMRAYSR